ncbi:MAG: hypothetical protein KA821_06935 [Chitinophagaceae bacterium]|nr:hypothetical protein [Chitinophagaceae bacterium]
MVSSLASFTGQYTPELLNQGRLLFEGGHIAASSTQDKTYNMTVADGVKKRQVMVRIEPPMVTNIFCTCGPKICAHVIAAFFQLQQELNVLPEAFDPAILGSVTKPDPDKQPKVNQQVAKAIARKTKPKIAPANNAQNVQGQFSATRLEAKAVSNLSGSDFNPIFNGADDLLEEAWAEYEEQNFEPVFAIAKAVLTGILRLGYLGGNGQLCCDEAAELIKELYNNEDVPPDLKENIFTWALKASQKELYEYYDTDLIAAVGTHPQTAQHGQIVLQFIQDKSATEMLSKTETDIVFRLLTESGKHKEAEEWKYRYAIHYRVELITAAMERKDYAEAKALATAGIPGRDEEACTQFLYEIAVAQNDPVALRHYHTEQLVKTGDLSHYEQLRHYSNDAEWPEVQNALLQVLSEKKCVTTLHKILKQENMAERMLAHVISHRQFELMIDAAPLLEGAYQQELLALLRRKLEYEAPLSLQRDRAKLYAEKIKAIRKVKGGKAMVSQFLTALFETHPGWKVLRSEVEKYM